MAAAEPKAVPKAPRGGLRRDGQALERVSFPVAGLGCASEAQRLERDLTKVGGLLDAVVNPILGEATVWYRPGEVSIRQLIQAVESVGYRTDSAPLKVGLKISGLR